MTVLPGLILWQYPPAFGLPSLSPFCVKVEAYLRLCGLPYTVRVTNNPKRGPYGKMPVLQDGAHRIADSRLIVAHIEATRGGGLDRHLGPEQRAIGHALQRTVEEHLYFAIMYSRWADPQGFRACLREFSPAFPVGLRRLALGTIRRMMVRQCAAQGFGRLAPAQAHALAVADIAAVEQLITGPFLFGARPSSFDACLYAFLQTIARFPGQGGGLRERTLGSPKLTTYLQEMEAACGFGTSES